MEKSIVKMICNTAIICTKIMAKAVICSRSYSNISKFSHRELVREVERDAEESLKEINTDTTENGEPNYE